MLNVGQLVFVARGERLDAQLVRDGARLPVKASLGPRGTVTLVLVQTAAGVRTTYTFFGALSADHQTLAGTFEEVKKEGPHEYTTSGSWSVKPQPTPEAEP